MHLSQSFEVWNQVQMSLTGDLCSKKHLHEKKAPTPNSTTDEGRELDWNKKKMQNYQSSSVDNLIEK